MPESVVDLFEIIKVHMHQGKICARANQARQDMIHGPPVLETSQGIGKGLFFCGDLGPLQTQVQLPRGLHGGRFCLHQI